MTSTAMPVDETGFTLFRGVCPGWDNEARRPNRGVSFVASSPDKYGQWLRWACREVMRTNVGDERLVFINAWNEWAEGAHLEPDRHFGHAYLRQTANALNRLALPETADTGPSIAAEAFDLPVAQMNLVAKLKVPLRRVKRALTTKPPGHAAINRPGSGNA
jgi:hypothetical protein